MSDNPIISVLMPVYNCAQYVEEAIDSILNQTFTDFEFLIIDDASTDETVSIIERSYDSRVKLIRKPENTGLTNSLNYGLSIARGKYIARMDGDDISLPRRLEKQLIFMDMHPEVVACGTTYSFINTNRIRKVPLSHSDIKHTLLRGSCLGHPTVMFRKSVFDKFIIRYDQSKEPAEDYDLWVRLLKYGKLHNLEDILLEYRIHETQVSNARHSQQLESASKTRLELLNFISHNCSINEEVALKFVLAYKKFTDYRELKNFLSAKYKIMQANNNDFFDDDRLMTYFVEIEKQMFDNYFLKRDTYFPTTFIHYLNIKYNFNYKLSVSKSFKLFIKSFIFFNKN